MSSVTPGFQGLPAFAQIYNMASISPNTGELITFDSNGLLNGFTHTVGAAVITAQTSGVFFIQWLINAEEGGAFALEQNGTPVTAASYISSAAGLGTSGQAILQVSNNDTFQFRNNTGVQIGVPTQSGYANASIVLMQIGNHS